MKFNNNTKFNIFKIGQLHQPLTSHLKIYYNKKSLQEIIFEKNVFLSTNFAKKSLKSNY